MYVRMCQFAREPAMTIHAYYYDIHVCTYMHVCTYVCIYMYMFILDIVAFKYIAFANEMKQVYKVSAIATYMYIFQSIAYVCLHECTFSMGFYLDQLLPLQVQIPIPHGLLLNKEPPWDSCPPTPQPNFLWPLQHPLSAVPDRDGRRCGEFAEDNRTLNFKECQENR